MNKGRLPTREASHNAKPVYLGDVKNSGPSGALYVMQPNCVSMLPYIWHRSAECPFLRVYKGIWGEAC